MIFLTLSRQCVHFYPVTQKMLTVTAESRGAETRALLPCHALYPVTLVAQFTVHTYVIVRTDAHGGQGYRAECCVRRLNEYPIEHQWHRFRGLVRHN